MTRQPVIAVASGKGGTGKTTLATKRLGADLDGRIPWDPSVPSAQLAGASVVEQGTGIAAEFIKTIWEKLEHAVQ